MNGRLLTGYLTRLLQLVLIAGCIAASVALTPTPLAAEAAAEVSAPVYGPANTSPPVKKEIPSPLSSLAGSTFKGLLIVLGTLCVGLALYKRISGDTIASGSRSNIDVLAKRMLSAKSAVAVIRYDGKELLVGYTDQHVSLVSDLTEKENFQASLEEFAEAEQTQLKRAENA